MLLTDALILLDKLECTKIKSSMSSAHCYFYLLNFLYRGIALALIFVAAQCAILPPSLISSYSLVRLIFAAVGWTFSLSLNFLTASV